MQGMFYRTARMLEAGIKPVFVFDGKPPEIKRAQLDQRLERWARLRPQHSMPAPTHSIKALSPA